tara:strand:+ start:1701 stop:1907 length:207 start_codon:yes stop_codon:yes gene_type:complete
MKRTITTTYQLSLKDVKQAVFDYLEKHCQANAYSLDNISVSEITKTSSSYDNLYSTETFDGIKVVINS